MEERLRPGQGRVGRWAASLVGGPGLGACGALSHFAAGQTGSSLGGFGIPPTPVRLGITLWYIRD